MTEIKIKCIAIDDEPLALDKMRQFISRINYLEMKGTYDNPLEAMTYIKENSVDLIFLDIQMEDLSGIQMMEALKECPKVIFTTAYDQYAIKGYELDIVDYLLKPISFERFLKAVEKTYAIIAQEHLVENKIDSKKTTNEEFLFIKTENRYEKVSIDEILYIQGLKDYLMVYTPKGRILTLQNFTSMLKVLPANKFARVHKSFIVSIPKIESIERNRIKIGEKLIPIGETYKKDFYELIDKKKI